MTSLADSEAFRDDRRVLAQHQAALTLLQARLARPGQSPVRWLDLCCGRGQILTSLKEVLSGSARSRLHYFGFDIDQSYAREAARTAVALELGSSTTHVGQLADLEMSLAPDDRFDFITLTNSAHEIGPQGFAEALFAAIARLTNDGLFFLYDMEALNPPELGALPWSRDEMQRVIDRALSALGVVEYSPEVARWQHSSNTGWSVSLERTHLNLSPDELSERRQLAEVGVLSEMQSLLKSRMMSCRAALDSLTMYGSETAEEEREKQRLLHEFWALSRLLRTDT